MKIMKYWQVLLLLFFIVISLFLIVPIEKKGVAVTAIAADSPFYGKVKVGETITWMNEKEINTPEDLKQFENATGVIRFLHSGKLDLVEVTTPPLGIKVSAPESSKLKFGLDLVGGTRVLLQPKESVNADQLDQILGTLETRINVYGLKETKFQIINDISGGKFIQAEVAGGTEEDIRNLLEKQGKFDGRIPREVIFANSTGTLTLGTKSHTVKLSSNGVDVDGTKIETNSTGTLDGIKFIVINATGSKAVLSFIVFTSSDIKSVCMQDQPGICTSRVVSQGTYWEFAFQVFLTQNGAENFAKVTSGLKPSPMDKSYLESQLYLHLDEKPLTTLSIASDLAGKALTEPSITGGSKTKEEATKEKIYLQSILQSGSLPVAMEIVKVDQISPLLGKNFIKSSMIAGLVAIIVVGLVVFIRYRSLKLALPVIMTSVSEVVVILGGSALIGWTIDLSGIAAIIAVVGTGIDAQVMILDEAISKEKSEAFTIKQKVKKAFFIIFSSAATIIAAMLPLLFIGIGAMRGFAIITIMGVLIGIFITRPAFGSIVEKLLEYKDTNSA